MSTPLQQRLHEVADLLARMDATDAGHLELLSLELQSLCKLSEPGSLSQESIRLQLETCSILARRANQFWERRRARLSDVRERGQSQAWVG